MHHFDALVATGIVAAAIVSVPAFGRAWPLLLPVPALVAGLAWYGWELSSEGAPLAIAIAVLGYGGLALGLGARHIARRRRISDGQ